MVSTEIETPPGTISSTFFISGREFDPDHLSGLLEVQPSEIWRQQRPWLKDRRDIPQISWRFDLTSRHHWSVDSAIREVLDIFSPRCEQITTFAREHNCEVHLRLILHDDETVIVYEIGAETMLSLAVLGCSLSFHMDYDTA